MKTILTNTVYIQTIREKYIMPLEYLSLDTLDHDQKRPNSPHYSRLSKHSTYGTQYFRVRDVVAFLIMH